MVVRVIVITLGAALLIAGIYFGMLFYMNGGFGRLVPGRLYAFA